MRPSDFEHLLLYSARRKLKSHAGSVEGDFLALDKALVRVKVLQQAGSGSQTVVVVPDPPNLIEHHAKVLATLSEDYRVVCFELPGFGFSHPSAGFRFTIEDQASAMIELFEKLGIKNAILEMACLGGFVGIEVAHQRPDLIRKLVLLQVPSHREAQRWAQRADLNGTIATPWAGQLFMWACRNIVTRHWYRRALPEAAGEDTYEWYASRALKGLDRGACFCLASAYQALHARPRAPLVLKQETVVVWGVDDPSHVLTDRHSSLEEISNARMIELSGCGHFPSLEATERYLPVLCGDTSAHGA